MTAYLPLILFGVLLNASAQLLLKEGMRQVGHFSFTVAEILQAFPKVALNPYILGGLFCYVVSVLVWLGVLSRVEVGAAYPLLSIGYIVTAIAGALWFGEVLTITRVSGILIIMLGVYLVTKS